MKSWKENNLLSSFKEARPFKGTVMHNWETMPRDRYEREFRGYKDPSGVKNSLNSEYEFILNLLESCSLVFYEEEESSYNVLILEKEKDIPWLKFYFDDEESLVKIEELAEDESVDVELLDIADFDVIDRKHGPVLRILDSSADDAEIVAQFPLYKNYIDMGIVKR